MQPGEILSLTWDQIDLQTGLIRFPDHDVDMGARTQRLLSYVRARQKDAPTNRVFRHDPGRLGGLLPPFSLRLGPQ